MESRGGPAGPPRPLARWEAGDDPLDSSAANSPDPSLRRRTSRFIRASISDAGSTASNLFKPPPPSSGGGSFFSFPNAGDAQPPLQYHHQHHHYYSSAGVSATPQQLTPAATHPHASGPSYAHLAGPHAAFHATNPSLHVAIPEGGGPTGLASGALAVDIAAPRNSLSALGNLSARRTPPPPAPVDYHRCRLPGCQRPYLLKRSPPAASGTPAASLPDRPAEAGAEGHGGLGFCSAHLGVLLRLPEVAGQLLSQVRSGVAGFSPAALPAAGLLGLVALLGSATLGPPAEPEQLGERLAAAAALAHLSPEALGEHLDSLGPGPSPQSLMLGEALDPARWWALFGQLLSQRLLLSLIFRGTPPAPLVSQGEALSFELLASPRVLLSLAQARQQPPGPSQQAPHTTALGPHPPFPPQSGSATIRAASPPSRRGSFNSFHSLDTGAALAASHLTTLTPTPAAAASVPARASFSAVVSGGLLQTPTGGSGSGGGPAGLDSGRWAPLQTSDHSLQRPSTTRPWRGPGRPGSQFLTAAGAPLSAAAAVVPQAVRVGSSPPQHKRSISLDVAGGRAGSGSPTHSTGAGPEAKRSLQHPLAPATPAGGSHGSPPSQRALPRSHGHHHQHYALGSSSASLGIPSPGSAPQPFPEHPELSAEHTVVVSSAAGPARLLSRPGSPTGVSRALCWGAGAPSGSPRFHRRVLSNSSAGALGGGLLHHYPHPGVSSSRGATAPSTPRRLSLSSTSASIPGEISGATTVVGEGAPGIGGGSGRPTLVIPGSSVVDPPPQPLPRLNLGHHHAEHAEHPHHPHHRLHHVHHLDPHASGESSLEMSADLEERRVALRENDRNLLALLLHALAHPQAAGLGCGCAPAGSPGSSACPLLALRVVWGSRLLADVLLEVLIDCRGLDHPGTLGLGLQVLFQLFYLGHTLPECPAFNELHREHPSVFVPFEYYVRLLLHHTGFSPALLQALLQLQMAGLSAVVSRYLFRQALGAPGWSNPTDLWSFPFGLTDLVARAFSSLDNPHLMHSVFVCLRLAPLEAREHILRQVYGCALTHRRTRILMLLHPEILGDLLELLTDVPSYAKHSLYLQTHRTLKRMVHPPATPGGARGQFRQLQSPSSPPPQSTSSLAVNASPAAASRGNPSSGSRGSPGSSLHSLAAAPGGGYFLGSDQLAPVSPPPPPPPPQQPARRPSLVPSASLPQLAAPPYMLGKPAAGSMAGGAVLEEESAAGNLDDAGNDDNGDDDPEERAMQAARNRSQSDVELGGSSSVSLGSPSLPPHGSPSQQPPNGGGYPSMDSLGAPFAPPSARLAVLAGRPSRSPSCSSSSGGAGLHHPHHPRAYPHPPVLSPRHHHDHHHEDGANEHGPGDDTDPGDDEEAMDDLGRLPLSITVDSGLVLSGPPPEPNLPVGALPRRRSSIVPSPTTPSLRLPPPPPQPRAAVKPGKGPGGSPLASTPSGGRPKPSSMSPPSSPQAASASNSPRALPQVPQAIAPVPRGPSPSAPANAMSAAAAAAAVLAAAGPPPTPVLADSRYRLGESVTAYVIGTLVSLLVHALGCWSPGRCAALLDDVLGRIRGRMGWHPGNILVAREFLGALLSRLLNPEVAVSFSNDPASWDNLQLLGAAVLQFAFFSGYDSHLVFVDGLELPAEIMQDEDTFGFGRRKHAPLAGADTGPALAPLSPGVGAAGRFRLPVDDAASTGGGWIRQSLGELSATGLAGANTAAASFHEFSRASLGQQQQFFGGGVEVSPGHPGVAPMGSGARQRSSTTDAPVTPGRRLGTQASQPRTYFASPPAPPASALPALSRSNSLGPPSWVGESQPHHLLRSTSEGPPGSAGSSGTRPSGHSMALLLDADPDPEASTPMAPLGSGGQSSTLGAKPASVNVLSAVARRSIASASPTAPGSLASSPNHSHGSQLSLAASWNPLAATLAHGNATAAPRGSMVNLASPVLHNPSPRTLHRRQASSPNSTLPRPRLGRPGALAQAPAAVGGGSASRRQSLQHQHQHPGRHPQTLEDQLEEMFENPQLMVLTSEPVAACARYHQQMLATRGSVLTDILAPLGSPLGLGGAVGGGGGALPGGKETAGGPGGSSPADAHHPQGGFLSSKIRLHSGSPGVDPVSTLADLPLLQRCRQLLEKLDWRESGSGLYPNLSKEGQRSRESGVRLYQLLVLLERECLQLCIPLGAGSAAAQPATAVRSGGNGGGPSEPASAAVSPSPSIPFSLRHSGSSGANSLSASPSIPATLASFASSSDLQGVLHEPLRLPSASASGLPQSSMGKLPQVPAAALTYQIRDLPLLQRRLGEILLRPKRGWIRKLLQHLRALAESGGGLGAAAGTCAASAGGPPAGAPALSPNAGSPGVALGTAGVSPPPHRPQQQQPQHYQLLAASGGGETPIDLSRSTSRSSSLSRSGSVSSSTGGGGGGGGSSGLPLGGRLRRKSRSVDVLTARQVHQQTSQPPTPSHLAALNHHHPQPAVGDPTQAQHSGREAELLRLGVDDCFGLAVSANAGWPEIPSAGPPLTPGVPPIAEEGSTGATPSRTGPRSTLLGPAPAAGLPSPLGGGRRDLSHQTGSDLPERMQSEPTVESPRLWNRTLGAGRASPASPHLQAAEPDFSSISSAGLLQQQAQRAHLLAQLAQLVRPRPLMELPLTPFFVLQSTLTVLARNGARKNPPSLWTFRLTPEELSYCRGAVYRPEGKLFFRVPIARCWAFNLGDYRQLWSTTTYTKAVLGNDSLVSPRPRAAHPPSPPEGASHRDLRVPPSPAGADPAAVPPTPNLHRLLPPPPPPGPGEVPRPPLIPTDAQVEAAFNGTVEQDFRQRFPMFGPAEPDQYEPPTDRLAQLHLSKSLPNSAALHRGEDHCRGMFVIVCENVGGQPPAAPAPALGGGGNKQTLLVSCDSNAAKLEWLIAVAQARCAARLRAGSIGHGLLGLSRSLQAPVSPSAQPAGLGLTAASAAGLP